MHMDSMPHTTLDTIGSHYLFIVRDIVIIIIIIL